jgi:hypothetical protein
MTINQQQNIRGTNVNPMQTLGGGGPKMFTASIREILEV